MHLDPYLLKVTMILFFLLLSSLILKKFNQPYVIAYLLTGVLLGPFGLKLITEAKLIEHIGSFGVVLLLFFVGLEIAPETFFKNWRVSFLGTLLQILFSVGAVFVLGKFFSWSFERSLLLGFVISLSSTSVVIQYLKEKNEMETGFGRDVLGVLIAQDLYVIPMLLIIGSFAEKGTVHTPNLLIQMLGAAFLIALLIFSIKYGRENFKGLASLKKDKETQVLTSLTFALGLSLLSGLFGLSTALGAFIAGAVIRAFKQIQWVHEALDSFKILFLAMFFVSIGLMVDIHFFIQKWHLILPIVLLAFMTNTTINTFILKSMGRNWGDSFRSGALLSQIGEFSFLLVVILCLKKITKLA